MASRHWKIRREERGAMPQYPLPGIQEVADMWPEERVKQMYFILDEATKLKHTGEVTHYQQEQDAPTDNDSPNRRHARAVPRFGSEYADYERVPAAVTQAGTKIYVNDDRQVEHIEMAGTGISDPLQKNLRENYKNNLHVSESGATSSHVPLRYDLIPRSLIEIAAQRYTDGAVKHGERGYQKGLEDWDFILNRINHITEHWNKLFHRADDVDEVESPKAHLGAILWGIGFLCELTDHEKGKYIFVKILELGRIRRI